MTKAMLGLRYVWAGLLGLSYAVPGIAAECDMPPNQTWSFGTSCEVTAVRHATFSVLIFDGATVTIRDGGAILFDPTQSFV